MESEGKPIEVTEKNVFVYQEAAKEILEEDFGITFSTDDTLELRDLNRITREVLPQHNLDEEEKRQIVRENKYENGVERRRALLNKSVSSFLSPEDEIAHRWLLLTFDLDQIGLRKLERNGMKRQEVIDYLAIRRYKDKNY